MRVADHICSIIGGSGVAPRGGGKGHVRNSAPHSKQQEKRRSPGLEALVEGPRTLIPPSPRDDLSIRQDDVPASRPEPPARAYLPALAAQSQMQMQMHSPLQSIHPPFPPLKTSQAGQSMHLPFARRTDTHRLTPECNESWHVTTSWPCASQQSARPVVTHTWDTVSPDVPVAEA